MFSVLDSFLFQICYDWSKGAQNYNPATATTKIYLHQPRVLFSNLSEGYTSLCELTSELNFFIITSISPLQYLQEGDVKPRVSPDGRK